MSSKFVTHGQPGSSVDAQLPGRPRNQKRAQKTSVGNVNPKLRSASTTLTKKELKREIRKDLNIEKVRVDGHTRLLYTVPECTQHYISARADPWNTAPGACLPSGTFNFPSMKCKNTASGSFRVGVNGVGYIALLPAGANNSANIVGTNSTSVGTGATALSAFTNLTTFNFSNIPFTSAQFGGDLLWRHVASGIRIQYVGALMNQNGIAFSFCDPDHSSVTNTASVNTFGNIETCRRVPITGSTMVQGGGNGQNWLCQVNDNGPVVPAELAFSNTPAVQATPYMVIAIIGTAGDLFEWEAVQHSEYQGPIVPSMTPSHVDEVSWPVVDDEMKQAFNHGPPQPKEEKGILARIGSALSEHLPRVVGAVGKGMAGLPAIISGLTNLIPMTGGNPLIANQGFSYPMLMAQQERIKTQHGRGSNLLSTRKTYFLDELVEACIVHDLTPQMFVETILGKADLPLKYDPDVRQAYLRKTHFSIGMNLFSEDFQFPGLKGIPTLENRPLGFTGAPSNEPAYCSSFDEEESKNDS